ncbi:MAG: hypothetical protein LGB70_02300 [Sulfurovum sp.]|nr:hypothetical protein [Sulfurovum sp.]
MMDKDKINSLKEALDSLNKPYGLASALEQVKVSTLGYSLKKTLDSLNKPYGLTSALEQVKYFHQATISNKEMIQKFQNIDMSEIVLLFNEFSNTLKPYENNINIATSNMKWFNLKDVKQAILELMTIYMFIGYFLDPSLEIKDLELSNSKQNKYISNLVKLKNKDLYYLTVRDNIVLRTNPYIKKSTVKARLDKDVELLVLLRKDNWLNVEYFDEKNQITQVGWVHIKNLKRIRKE